MNNLYNFTKQLFTWANDLNISIIHARPKMLEQDFVNTDLDIIIKKSDISKIVQIIRNNHYRITSYYERTDGETYHFYGYGENKGTTFHIDFITSLKVKGLPYLKYNEIISRSHLFDGMNYMDSIDQLLVILLTHGLKHKTIDSQLKYKEMVQATPL